MPSKDRLAEAALDFLAACGLAVEKPNPRQYAAHIPTLPGLTVLFQCPGDIIVSVRDGSVDLGITGMDMVAERQGEDGAVLLLHDGLGFGHCRLALAVMVAIPARIAGVDEIIVYTPPGKQAGRVSQATLAAAHIAGADRLFRLGGAQAIGALAFGTASMPRVDKIVGAGGLFTTLAKRQVFGLVGLDGLYGPTETVIVADETANPTWVTADLLAQAEHDVLATAILLTPSRRLAEAMQAEVLQQIKRPDRAEVISTSLDGQGGIVLAPDLVVRFISF